MSSVLPTLLSVYRYDPLDRMISQTQTNTPELQRFYCQNRLATEIQGTLRHAIFQHDDLLLAQQQCKGKVIGTTLLATDLQRSVLQTLEAGRPPIPITYAPYGHSSAESGLTSLLGFNGERSDPVTGDYLLGNGYRAFTPVLMRFKSPDSLSPFGKGGLNSFAYCSNNPISFSDPSGHMLKGIVNSISPPKVPDVISRNSLEGIDLDTFQKISKYLSQKDMDNLAQVSRSLHDKSIEVSKSNLATKLVSTQKRKGRVNNALHHAYFEGAFSYPAPQGIGSAAYKKLHGSIEGPDSLFNYVERRYYPAHDHAETALRKRGMRPNDPGWNAKIREETQHNIAASLLRKIRKTV